MSTTNSAANQVHVITPQRHLLDVDYKELWRYRDLIFLFVKRDFIAVYKQTIMGPLWFFIQPIFTTLIFTFVFGKAANFAPSGAPVFLYYLSGIILWQYFADCFKKTADTFITNQGIFGKVYFPRLVVPISIVVSSLLKLGVQLILFVIMYIVFYYRGANVGINSTLLLFPLLVLIMAGLGMGFGLVITSLTTKYRDLKFLLDFGIQLVMYITPGIIMSYEDFIINMPRWKWVININPLGPVIETFKHAAVDAGTFSWPHLAYSIGFMIVSLFFGIIIFNRTEKNFMDTV